jgi:subtilisin-like proprotein convertase family protein
LSHNYPADIDMLLVSPAGAAVRLMSDAGSEYNVTNIVLRFTDTVTNRLPNLTVLQSGTYAPTDYGTPLDVFPLPAPGSVTATNFVPFLGTSANGNWSLFIRDDLGGDGGTIASGWTLDIEWQDTPPMLTAPQYQPDGSFSATLLGLPHMTHVVESSYDLVNWSPVSTNTLSGPLRLTFEPAPDAPPRCFFRAVRCP